jgi:hypothetical protein
MEAFMQANFVLSFVPQGGGMKLVLGGRRGVETIHSVTAGDQFGLRSGTAYGRLAIAGARTAGTHPEAFLPRAYTVLSGRSLTSAGWSIGLVVGDLIAWFHIPQPTPVGLAVYPGWGSRYAALEMWSEDFVPVVLFRIAGNNHPSAQVR